MSTQEEQEQTMRRVDLTQQITNRLIHGFPIAIEDIREAEELGIDVELITITVGECYETQE